MANSPTKLTFRIFKNHQLIREETLDQAVIKVGKLASSHLRLQDDSVSRMHAVIETTRDAVTIIDLGSTTGTHVNGEKINKATLHHGDMLVLGDLRMEIAIPSQAGAVDVESAAVCAPPPIPSPALASPPASGQVLNSAVLASPVLPSMHAPIVPMLSSPQVVRGPEAIEVSAKLGDSVVGVKHVMNPRGGKVSGTTRALFGAGAVLLLASALAFVSGVGTAGDNATRYHEHLDAKKAAHEFRPERLSAAFDWMAIGGLLGGVLCMTMGLLRIREEKVEPRFRIGRASGVDFPTEDSPLEDFSLVAPQDDTFVFHFVPTWQGELMIDGERTALSELASQGRAQPSTEMPGAMAVPIPANANIWVQTGKQHYSVSSVAQPKRQPTPLFSATSSELVSYIAASAVVMLGFVFLLDSLSADQKTLWGDAFADNGRLADVRQSAKEDPIEEIEESEHAQEEEAGGTGTKMAGQEGTMGKKDSKKTAGQFSIKNRDTDPRLAKRSAIESARVAGVLGLMASNPNGGFSDLTSSAEFSSGLDDRDIYGGLVGDNVGEMAGGWGYGIHGVGAAAGGIGYGTIGTGNYGLLGHGDGTGTGYTTGEGKGAIRKHVASPPKVDIGPIDQDGDLDPEIIRRHIRRKLSRIRHCYEKELLVLPELRGTVVTQFQISPTGRVQGLKAKGLGNRNVETCVGAAIESIQFPKSKGGGYVNVRRYPFTFHPAG